MKVYLILKARHVRVAKKRKQNEEEKMMGNCHAEFFQLEST